MHATKRDSGKIGGHVVLVIGPFCSAIQAKWIGRPLTWREICSSGGLLLTVGVSGVFVVFAFLNCGQRATEMPGQVKNCS